MIVCDWPSVIVVVTFLTPEMLATASSTRLETCVSSSLGATPGSLTVTEISTCQFSPLWVSSKTWGEGQLICWYPKSGTGGPAI